MPGRLSDAIASGHIIVVANAELAAAIFDAIERQASAASSGVWRTPRVRDFGGWLREQYERRQLIDASLPRLLSEGEERELWRGILLEDDAAQLLLEPNGAARAARRARRALLEYGIPITALSDASSEETDAFLRWHARFELRCRELNCIAADQALQHLDLPHEPLAWIDAASWRPVARQWLQRQAGEALTASQVVCQTVRHVRAESSAAELALIAEWAADGLRKLPNFRAWICVPDLALRRDAVKAAFDAVLAAQRFALHDAAHAAPYAIAGGTALADFAPVRAVLDVMQAASGSVPFERFSALLRMPALQVDREQASLATRIELELRRRGPADAPLRDWLDLSDAIAAHRRLPPAVAVARLRDVLVSLEQHRGALHMSRWVEVWIDAWHRGPWLAAPRWSSAEYQAAMRLRELLGALASADRIFGKVTRLAAQGVLERAAHETSFQPQTGIPSIWISSQLMDPWLSYDGVWIARCAEDAWPPAVDPVPLLPIVVQRAYAVTAAAAATQLVFAQELQARWLARARECVFSCAAAEGEEGASTTALSPILPAPTSAGAAPCLAQPHPHWRVMQAGAPPFESIDDAQAPAFTTGERTRGVSTLRAQSQCAFRGFAETRLSASTLDVPVPGFNELERGELTHFALEYVWRDLADSRTLQAMTSESLARLIDAAAIRAIERCCKRRDPGRRWRERERVRLSSLLTLWLDAERRRMPFTVEEIEAPARSLMYGGLEFAVRIDRIDRLDDGSRILIDYKTGSVNADWRGERPHNPQLPMYALCQPDDLIAVAYGQVKAGDTRFVAESERAKVFGDGGRGNNATKLEGMPSFAALTELWRRRVEALGSQLAAGRAEVAPLPQACRRCGLQVLCRVRSALDDEPDDA